MFKNCKFLLKTEVRRLIVYTPDEDPLYKIVATTKEVILPSLPDSTFHEEEHTMTSKIELGMRNAWSVSKGRVQQ